MQLNTCQDQLYVCVCVCVCEGGGDIVFMWVIIIIHISCCLFSQVLIPPSESASQNSRAALCSWVSHHLLNTICDCVYYNSVKSLTLKEMRRSITKTEDDSVPLPDPFPLPKYYERSVEEALKSGKMPLKQRRMFFFQTFRLQCCGSSDILAEMTISWLLVQFLISTPF